MNEVIKEWVVALRSGKYVQTYNRLGDVRYGHCALGVLCELAHEKGITTRTEENGIYYYDKCSAIIPASVASWAGISLNLVLDTPSGKRHTIMHLNDTASKSFDYIANCIERTFK